MSTSIYTSMSTYKDTYTDTNTDTDRKKKREDTILNDSDQDLDRHEVQVA